MPTSTERRHTLDADALLALAMSRPLVAERQARSVLAGRPAPIDEAVARQALGIVLRDLGDTKGAKVHLRRALRLRREAGDPVGVADVLSTLGITHALAGEVSEGIACFTEAESLVDGPAAGRVLTRLGYVLALVGRHDEAMTALSTAVPLLERAGDRLWEARARNNRGRASITMGNVEQADADFAWAEEWFGLQGQEVEQAIAQHNRGAAAGAAGQIPKALDLFHRSSRRFEELGVFIHEAAVWECWTLLAAGLAADAQRRAADALALVDRRRGQGAVIADLALFAARAALAAQEPDAARTHARHAERLFRRQGRDGFAHVARSLQLEAALQRGKRPHRGDVRTAVDIAERLSALGAEESTGARLLAGRIALSAQRPEQAVTQLTAAATSRRRGSAIDRVTGWLAQALLCRTMDNPRAMLAACSRGLDVLEEYRLTLGATEARATATTHGRELVEIALRHAVATNDAHKAVRWNERLRSTQWLPGSAEDRADPALVAELAAVRDVSRQLAEQQGDEAALARLRRRRDQLEASVRSRALRREAGPAPVGGSPAARTRFADRWRPPAGTALVELFELDGTLYAVTATSRRTKLHEVGPADAAATSVQHGQTLLRRTARGAARHTDQLLAAAGQQLQTRLLGPAAAEIERSGAQTVVLVATARHYAAPWTLLPVLADLGVSVWPSSQAWRGADAPRPPRDGPGAGGAG
ncbi:MAG: tetratricopeptide repeat protein, partial [Actinobacteria bacterium]|nr:tetratricopeptide repeat protein [Actinomycetota bacterium]